METSRARSSRELTLIDDHSDSKSARGALCCPLDREIVRALGRNHDSGGTGVMAADQDYSKNRTDSEDGKRSLHSRAGNGEQKYRANN